MTESATAPAAPDHMYQSHNDLPASSRQRLIALLNDHLASLLDLYSQPKYAHWNVKGIEHIDSVAERITALGGTAVGTVRIAAARSALPEYPFDAVDGAAHIEALVEAHGHFAAAARAGIAAANEHGDLDAADLYTDISRVTDKHLWLLEAHLQAYRQSR